MSLVIPAAEGSSPRPGSSSSVRCLRIMSPHDRPFVASTWIRQYQRQVSLDPEVYRRGQVPLVDMLLSCVPTQVCYLPEVPDEILGWACQDGDVLHYAYIKPVYRAHLTPEELFTCPPKFHTHRMPLRLPTTFNPYLLHAYFAPYT